MYVCMYVYRYIYTYINIYIYIYIYILILKIIKTGLGLFDCKFWLNNPVSLMNTELSQLKPEELALVKVSTQL